MLWISAVIAVGFGIITLVGIMPFLRKRIVEAEAQSDARCAPASRSQCIDIGGGRKGVRGSTMLLACLCVAVLRNEGQQLPTHSSRGDRKLLASVLSVCRRIAGLRSRRPPQPTPRQQRRASCRARLSTGRSRPPRAWTMVLMAPRVWCVHGPVVFM